MKPETAPMPATIPRLSTCSRKDLLAALEHAVRYGAFSLVAVERNLAVQASPKTGLDSWGEQDRHYLQELGQADLQESSEGTLIFCPKNGVHL